MSHKRLRTLALALAATSALGAVSATGASAGTFKADSYPARITGEQTTQIVFTGVVGSWKCNGLNMQGELSAESSSLNLTPSYSECSWAGIAATVNMEGCTYEYTAGSTIEGNENKIQATMDVRCPTGKEIKLTLTNNCTIRIPEQSGLGSVTLENKLATEPMDVDLQLNVSGMTYRVEHGNFCPNTPADGTYNNGTLKGEETLKAENPETSKGLGFTIA
jgi:hypothetical protein